MTIYFFGHKKAKKIIAYKLLYLQILRKEGTFSFYVILHDINVFQDCQSHILSWKKMVEVHFSMIVVLNQGPGVH